TRANGRLHGPGVFDMKAGIAIGMLATRALLERGPSLPHRIVMLWTSDEEIGSESSRAAIGEEAAGRGAEGARRRGGGGRRRRRARGHRAAERRERSAGACPPDPAHQRAAGSR